VSRRAARRGRALYAVPIAFAAYASERAAWSQAPAGPDAADAPPLLPPPQPLPVAPPTRESPAPDQTGAAAPSRDELLDRLARLERRLEQLATQPRGSGPEAAGSGVRALGPDGGPLAGYSDKQFFLRDAGDDFVLIPKGRVQLDYYLFPSRGDLPAGVLANSSADPRPKDVLFIRRARLGMAGTVAKILDYRVEAEFASLATPGQYATLADASIVLDTNPYVQFEAGQFYAPFTLENATSENYTDFTEKALITRFAVPTSRETGGQLLGEAPHKIVRYWIGIFEGDGQNFKSIDNKPAVIGRAVVAPFAAMPDHPKWMEDVWIGGSFWYKNAVNEGGAAAPSTSGATAGDLSSVTTQGGWSVFSSNYSNGVTGGNAVRSHLAPDGVTSKFAFELNVPVMYRVGLRGEYVSESIDFREYNDVSSAGTVTRATGAAGNLSGSGGYVEVYGWLGREISVDRPGVYQIPHWRGYQPPPPPGWALMFAAKYEHLGFDVTRLPQTTNASGKVVADAAVGHYALDVLELGASLYYTRHARFSINYVLNYIGGGDGQPSTALGKNLFFRTAEHELLLRWAVSF